MTQRTRFFRLAILLLPSAALAQNYQGSFDAAWCSSIGGWAWDAQNPSNHINVDIYDGSTYITSVPANIYRPDLAYYQIGDGSHAFSIATPSPFKDGNYHTVNVKYGGTSLLLPNGPHPVACTPGSTGYLYYLDDSFSSINSSVWHQNGTVTTSSAGFTSSAANGGSLISSVGAPTTLYEVQAILTLTQTGGGFALYAQATPDALYTPTSSTGSAYVAALQNVTFSGGSCNATLGIYKHVNGGTPVTLTSTVWSCHNGMALRFVATSLNQLAVYVDNAFILVAQDSSLTNGKPGVGVWGAPSTNGIARADLGPHDGIAPTAVNSQLISTSLFPTRVDMQWGSTVDDSNGTGIAFYQVFRNGTYLGNFETSNLTDTVTAASNSYLIRAFDYHLNFADTTVSVTMPPADSIDPRQVGVRPLGSYWGGGGEQIDMRSGNLNYTMPLIKAQSRGGWGVGLNLSYNSQNWRQDSVVWQLGRDIGYGYGWRLQAGSLTPIYDSFWHIDHWLYIDSTGAEYKLDQFTNGVWTSKEGTYLTFDPAGRLYFPDGSFWVFGCMSAASEQDAGTFYPTLIEDTNGNQIMLTYKPGQGLSYGNSSGRIATIEDVRGKGVPDYTFTYNTDPIPHLTDIANTASTPENYHLTYTASTALLSPFDAHNFGTFTFLQSVRINLPNLTTSFTYNPVTDSTTNPPTNGLSGELTQMTTPYGGHLRWTYAAYALSGSRSFREVQNRYLLLCASNATPYCSAAGPAAETQHQLFRDPADSGSRNVHYYADLIDYGASSHKVWFFQTNTSPTQFNGGLQLNYQEWNYPSTAQKLNQDFTWSQTPTSLNPYISSTLTTLDPGQSFQAQKKTIQTRDQYGNVTQIQAFDFGNLSVAARIYTNTYLSDTNYVSRYIRNRLVDGVMVGGAQSVSLVHNVYDGVAPANVTGLHEHDDANYGSAFLYRGNLITSSSPGVAKSFGYDIGGNVIGSTVNGVSTTVITDASTNWAAPAQMTTNSLTSILNWTSALNLSSAAGPNGDTASFGYDTTGRPYTTTAPTGATTTYTYSDNPPSGTAPYKTATTNGHWV